MTDTTEQARNQVGASAAIMDVAVGVEVRRIKALFEPYEGDAEDLISYARDVAAMRAVMPQPTSTVEAGDALRVAREALTKCRDKFRHYTDLNLLKCTSEGDEKADRNREMADLCDAALAKLDTAEKGDGDA